VSAPRSPADQSGSRAPEPLPRDTTSPQFTLRAVLTGMILGALLSACNIYIGLRIGLSLNMSLTAALVGYGFWMTLRGVAGVRHWELLENNINQTACSSAASVGAAGLIGPIPALALLTGQTLTWHYLALWILSVCLVGITVAIALRRQMILRENLPFVAGLVSAETLRELYARGSDAVRRILVLVGGAAVAAPLYLLSHFAPATLPAKFTIGLSIRGFASKALGFGLHGTLMLYAIGALIGIRAGLSLLVGAILAWGVIAPDQIQRGNLRLTATAPLTTLPADTNLPTDPQARLRYDARRGRLSYAGIMTTERRDALLAPSADPAYHDAITALHAASQLDRAQPNHRDCVQWLLWPGVTLMVVGGLTSLLFSWRSMLHALTGRRDTAEPVDAGEVSRRWFLLALGGALLLSVVLQVSFFAIVWWAAILSVLVAFVLAAVAARVSGETGITPVGAMGKVAQILFGGTINPATTAQLSTSQLVSANVMTSNVSGGAASQCADLLNDLKCGHLLGASPRLQALAQVAGALAGAMVGSAVYLVLIPRPAEQLMTAQWPAPAATALKAVAELFLVGIEAIPTGTPLAILIAGIVAIALAVLERTLPAPVRRFTLSPTSLGLAFVIGPYMSLTLFAGALTGLVLSKLFAATMKSYLVAACAGIIAGESLAGIGVVFAQTDWLALFERE
jgi:uncharacterized oligopeptide transporter (OPT) family protein